MLQYNGSLKEWSQKLWKIKYLNVEIYTDIVKYKGVYVGMWYEAVKFKAVFMNEYNQKLWNYSTSLSENIIKFGKSLKHIFFYIEVQPQLMEIIY